MTRVTQNREAALRRKVPPDPIAATMNPPNAGPIPRVILKVTAPSMTASGTSSRGTRSGMIACHAGPLMAIPKPRAKVAMRRIEGVV